MRQESAEAVRVVFVGVGSMGQCAHLVNYASIPGCKVVALAELRPGLGAAVGARYGVERVYRDAGEMLSREKFDAVVHINQFERHGQTLPMLAEVGKPVLIEKPLASSPEVGEGILRLMEARGTKCYVAYHKRSDPAVMAARELMSAWRKSGEFGGLRYVRVAMPPGDWIAGGFEGLIRSDETLPPVSADAAPAGVEEGAHRYYVHLVNYYIHQVNLLRHLIGDYEVMHADASGVVLVARSGEGVPAVIEMGTHWTKRAWEESVFVAFAGATLTVELPAPLAMNRPGKLTVRREPKEGEPYVTVPDLPWVHAMRQQAVHFIAAVRGEETSLATAQDAMKDLRTMRQYMELYRKAGGALKA